MTKLENIDLFVYICIVDRNLNTVTEISKFLKIEKPRIYESISRLINLDKIVKMGKKKPYEYFISYKMTQEKENIEEFKQNPEMTLDLIVSFMDKVRWFRNYMIRTAIQKSSQREAINEWLAMKKSKKRIEKLGDEATESQKLKLEQISIDRRNWVRENYFNDKNNFDVFINAMMLAKDTKDEDLMIRYLVKNIK